jgi:hypothetical protein
MQGVSRSLGRMAAVLAVSSLLVTQGAFAYARQDDRGGLLVRAKHVIVRILSEFGFPPG